MAPKLPRSEIRQPPIATSDISPINYPFNHWWVAALSEEVEADRVVERRILGKSVIFFRNKAGEIVALENRCAHRAAPLALGHIQDDEVVCFYHGFRYGRNGKCTHIPTQTKVPPSVAVKSYPVVENKPLVWIWTGAETAEGAPPALPWLSDPGWVIMGSAMPLQANYMSLKENVLDLTHFGFVHASTFKILDWTRPPDVTVGADNSVQFEQKFSNTTIPSIDAPMMGLSPTRRADRATVGRSISPAMHEARSELTLLDAAPEERNKFFTRFLHITTPESPRRTHYWWFRGSDYGQGTPEAAAEMKELVIKGFLEDKLVLEAIQSAADSDPDYAYGPEISVEADRSGLQARRMLYKLLQKERGPASQTAASDDPT